MNRPNHGGNLTWAAAIAGCPASVILDFSASINPLGPPKSALQAIKNSLEGLTAYPDPDYSQLRLGLAEWHEIPPEWLLPGNGSAELLTWACKELAAMNVTYLITPAFGDYWRALNTFSAQIKTCPLVLVSNQWSLKLPSEVNSQQVGLLINNPHNPTGQLFTIEELIPYLESFGLVVVDEAFMDFLLPSQQQSLISLVTNFPNLVILRSLTKFYSLPGLRLGYAIAHPDRLLKWQKWRDPWPVNILAAEAALAVIQDHPFQQLTWDWLIPTRTQLWRDLNSIAGLECLEGAANFLLVKATKPSSKIQEFLLKHHQLLIRDCLSFPELGEQYFRIAIKNQADNQRLVKALKHCLVMA